MTDRSYPASWAGILVDQWLEAAKEPRPPAVEGVRFRHSQAGGCSRAIAYDALGAEPTDPMDVAGVWVTGIGTAIHERWQHALVEWAITNNADVATEVPCVHLVDDQLLCAGHADAVVTYPDGHRILLELKTVNGTGFRRMFTGNHPEGPRISAVIQGALNASALECAEMVICYASMESISVYNAQKLGIIGEQGRFLRDCHYDATQIAEIAGNELARWRNIAEDLDMGELIEREIPRLDPAPRMHIDNPMNGSWHDANGNRGRTWHCDYCKHRSRCCDDA